MFPYPAIINKKDQKTYTGNLIKTLTNWLYSLSISNKEISLNIKAQTELLDFQNTSLSCFCNNNKVHMSVFWTCERRIWYQMV